MRGARALAAALSVLLVASAMPATAVAQPSPSPALITEARKHYETGLQLTRDEAYEAALAEFERAYQLAPNFRILYNIGGIHRQLNDFAGALRALEQYLAEGGTSVPAARRGEVQKDVDVLRKRVGRVRVAVDLEGADVTVDDVPAGKSPLADPLVVNPGRRRIGVAKRDYLPATSVVTIVGGETITVELSPTKLVADATVPPGGPSTGGPSSSPSLRPPSGAETSPSSSTSSFPASPRWSAPPPPSTRFDSPMILGWGATLALGVAAAFAGRSALLASDTLKRERTSEAPSRGVLDAEQRRTRTLALTADILGIAAVVTASFAGYFTVRAVGARSHRQPSTVGASR